MCLEPRAVRAVPVLLAALTALLLSGCAWRTPAAPQPVASSSAPPAAPIVPPPAPAPRPPPEPAPVAPPQAVATPVQGGLPGAIVSDSSAVSTALLAYAERLRRMTPAELTQELARLSDIPDVQRQPSDEIQLALVLGQTRVPADLSRAQAALQRVLTNPREDTRGLQPLAALLSARYGEQRRLEELLDKQAQQLKEQQRRIDQLNERLEAVRAIERSLTSRPAPANNTQRLHQP